MAKNSSLFTDGFFTNKVMNVRIFWAFKGGDLGRNYLQLKKFWCAFILRRGFLILFGMFFVNFSKDRPRLFYSLSLITGVKGEREGGRQDNLARSFTAF